MAVRTQQLCSLDDDRIVLSFDWDDVTGDLILGRCVNTSTRWGVHVLVQGTGGGPAGRPLEATMAAGSGTTEIAIPAGQRPRYPIVIDAVDGTASVAGYTVRIETI